MCNDLLPENVNAFLDDVETGLCLPILLLIVLCTLQFILNHTLDIACTIATAVTAAKSSMELAKEPSPAEDCESMPQKLKGSIKSATIRQ